MDRTVRFRAGSLKQHAFNYQPPDPVWAPKEYLARVRAGLRAYDPRVALWWGGSRGRWRLMEWIHSRGEWSYIAYWEGAHAEYRQPEVGGMVRLLQRLAQNTEDMIAGMDDHNQRVTEKRRDDFVAASREYLRDLAGRAVGGKIVVGGDYIRKRNWLEGEAAGHHRKFVIDHLRKQNEMRNGRAT